MSIFKRIKNSDVVVVPYTANKQWNFSNSDINSNNIYIYTGTKMTGSFDPSKDPMTTNSQYKRLVYESVNHQFYNAYSGSYLNTSSAAQTPFYETVSIYGATSSYNSPLNISYATASFPEVVGNTIKVLSIPTGIYGNAIDKNTFSLSSSFYQIQDDGYGNLKSSGSCIGNIFYEYGIAVITDQSYQSFFEDTTTTPLHWSCYNNNKYYNVDGNLYISVNGVEKVLTGLENSGQFTVNVGDTIFIESWSQESWPSNGTSSLNLNITGKSPVSTSLNGTHLTSSFVVSNQSPIYVNAQTNFTANVVPARFIWSLDEYTESGSVFLDANFKLQSPGGGTVYLNQSNAGTGSFNVMPGVSVELVPTSYTNDGGSSSYWGAFISASLFGQIAISGETLSSVSTPIVKNGGLVSGTSTPSVTVNENTTYYINVSTRSPRMLPTASINWRLKDYTEGSSVSLKNKLRIQSPGGGTVYLNQITAGSGSLVLPSDTIVEVVSYSLTNDASSTWNNYVSASLTGVITSSGTVLGSSTVGVGRNNGTISEITSPTVTLLDSTSYYINVESAPTLVPVSMSFSSTAVGGLASYVDNGGLFSNTVTSPWFMAWDRTLASGQIQPEDSTYAPFAFSGVPFSARSYVNGQGTTWGDYTSCNTTIDVYENATLVASNTQFVTTASHPSTGSWDVYASVTFTPVSGSTYLLNAYNSNLASGSAAVYYTYTLGYDTVSNDNACADYAVSPVSVYSPSSSLSVGINLYSNTPLSTPVVNGKYSDGSIVYTVVSGSITSSTACTTPSSVRFDFQLSLDSGNTGYLDVYTESPIGSGFILSRTLTGTGSGFINLLDGDRFYTSITHTARTSGSQRGQIDTRVNGTSVNAVVTTSGVLPKTIDSAITTLTTGDTFNVYAICGDQV